MPKHDQIVDDELRAQLGQAHQDMRNGKGNDAVRGLSDAYLYMLKMRPEMLDEEIEPRPGFKMFTVMRWPMLGANLTLESVRAKQPVIDFKRDHFAVSEAITYYEYILDTALSRDM
jgi:hypothetical protein